MIREARSAVEA
ncbi:TPA: hypothetical protein N0F65_007323 [Lagenidium giganteum]|uniref:Uncharacterized protein n=1 Tax=Lagenidium giganteum TaxID=4803 RepID=A0AAV2Z549_9STRA|nr:TPA: hypothetical protein N0F65_007323 [Lagenidium giganteum]